MAQNEQIKAEYGTKHNERAICPSWDNIGKEQLPFFNPTEMQKRAGFRVKFIIDGPRKETVNSYDPHNPKPELWFDVEIKGIAQTWTICQVSLLPELKKHEPLKNKVFDIKLMAVTEEFCRDNPKYRGKDRYDVKEIQCSEKDCLPVDIEDI